MWLIIQLGICVLAGWATGKIMKGAGYGLVGDLLLGLVGGWLGGFLLAGFLVGGGLIVEFLVRLVGAIALVAIVRLIRKV